MSDSESNSKNTIWMITEASPKSSETEDKERSSTFRGGLIGSPPKTVPNEAIGQVPISISTLQQNLSQFFDVVSNLFIKAEEPAQTIPSEENNQTKPGIKLDQIELSVAVNGEGEVGFWGLAKGKAGGATEIKLTFKRQEN